ncbi:hypothetical protein LguiB_018126 [Lonicera macranthoides]
MMTGLNQLVLANNNLSSMRKRTVAIEVVVGVTGVLALGIVVAVPLTFSRQFYRVNDEHIEMGESRYSIVIGVAQGLAFLHGSTSGPILLLDLLSESILLKSLTKPQVDDIELYKVIDPSKSTGSLSAVAGSVDYIPPIDDIELYKVIDPSKSTGSLSAVAGSVDYIPPKYAYTMRVTMAGNVYSYGVILLELVTGKAAVSEGIELA